MGIHAIRFTTLLVSACFATHVGCQLGAADTGKQSQPVHNYNISFEEITEQQDGKAVDKNPFRFFNSCFGDAGRMGPDEWRIKWEPDGAVTARSVSQWAGMWHSLEGLARESDRVLDFRRCYPTFIRDEFQPQCVGLQMRAKGKGYLKLEVKSAGDSILWSEHVRLNSESYKQHAFSVPTEQLDRAKLLNWVVEYGTVSIDEIALIIEFPDLPIETRAFLKSYAKLARCYDESVGIVRDRANWPVGDYDSVPASGLFCLATCVAADVGIVKRKFATETLLKVHRTLDAVPTSHGLLPHFVRRYDGQYQIHTGTEFSTVDHALYAFSMMLAATILEEPEIVAEVTNGIRQIDFDRLRNEQGRISHGFSDDGTRLDSVWWDWGSESALVLMLERIAVGQAARLQMSSSGKVHNEVGFIPLLCDLFTQRFDADTSDAISKQNWHRIKRALLAKQQAYFPKLLPDSQAARRGIYGLSAGEGPNGVGYVANGTALDGVRLIHPHYILMSAMLLPSTNDAYERIGVLETEGLFPPWGLVENVDVDLTQFLPMNGSLNASFEAISSYNLRQKHLGVPNAIYAAAENCQPFAEALDVFYPPEE